MTTSGDLDKESSAFAENNFTSSLDSVSRILTDKYQITESLGDERKFSIDFDNILDDEYLLIKNPSIHDIFHSDSSLIVSLKATILGRGYTNSTEMLIHLKTTEEQVAIIKKDFQYGYVWGYFVVTISSVKYIDFSTDVSYYEDHYFELELDYSSIFIGTGTTIEIVPVER